MSVLGKCTGPIEMRGVVTLACLGRGRINVAWLGTDGHRVDRIEFESGAVIVAASSAGAVVSEEKPEPARITRHKVEGSERWELCGSCRSRAFVDGSCLVCGGTMTHDETIDAHAASAGELCTDDGSGCCGVCGVGLDTCELCGGTGYHREGCADSDATTEGE